MYRIPSDLDLNTIIGEPITQLRIGQYDIQFNIGNAHFSVWSPITLVKEGAVIGKWEEDRWPDPSFKDILNVNVVNFDIPNDRLIILYYENLVEMHLEDSSDQFESMSISIEGETGPWII